MKQILLFGAGLSAGQLIDFLHTQAQQNDWQIALVDALPSNLARYGSLERVTTHQLDINDHMAVQAKVDQADAVISMLPAFMHPIVAKACLAASKSLFTASYVSPEIQTMAEEVQQKGLFFLFECGLDPGIDHMSAMQVLDEIRDAGGKILRFESFTGGLVAPESDDNPWNYKFSWNPRNVVLAGQGTTSKFLHNGKYKYIPYHQLFRRTEFLEIEGWGAFEGYANRDSLKYKALYGLDDVQTLYRGTLRRMRFGKAWDVFVKLGLTDDSYQIEDLQNMSFRQFINSFLPYNEHDAVELKLMHQLKLDQDSTIMEKLRWLGIFEDRPIGMDKGSPAQVLQKLLEEKWRMKDEDNDMVVMLHRFGYELEGEYIHKDAWMVECGQGKNNTAMAKTVGLPLAMAVSAWLKGEISLTGLHIPIKKEIYAPIMQQLSDYGIQFHEKKIDQPLVSI
jgi:saccharopine dehydrogenase (NAD+, L-glutamate forming)